MRVGTACYCEVWRTVLWDGTGIPTVQIRLPHEFRNSLLLEVWRTVGRYRDTSRSNTVCYTRLGTACYCEVWRTVGRYRDTYRSDTVRYIRLGTTCYCEVWRTVGQYRDTNRSDTICCVRSQVREVDTAVKVRSMLKVTGKDVTPRQIHRQSRRPNWFQKLQFTGRKM